MDQFPKQSVEFGKWVPNKYDKTEIFKAAPGISVSAKAVPNKTSFGINLMGKELDVNFKTIDEAKTEALVELEKYLSSAHVVVIKAQVEAMPIIILTPVP